MTLFNAKYNTINLITGSYVFYFMLKLITKWILVLNTHYSEPDFFFNMYYDAIL